VILKLTKFLKTYLKHYNYEQKIRSFAASLPEPLYYELKDLNQMKGNYQLNFYGFYAAIMHLTLGMTHLKIYQNSLCYILDLPLSKEI
jgi:hypothetical protein